MTRSADDLLVAFDLSSVVELGFFNWLIAFRLRRPRRPHFEDEWQCRRAQRWSDAAWKMHR
jgi:hypothetical protein